MVKISTNTLVIEHFITWSVHVCFKKVKNNISKYFIWMTSYCWQQCDKLFLNINVVCVSTEHSKYLNNKKNCLMAVLEIYDAVILFFKVIFKICIVWSLNVCYKKEKQNFFQFFFCVTSLLTNIQNIIWTNVMWFFDYFEHTKYLKNNVVRLNRLQ